MYSVQDTAVLPRWVAPFGNPRIKACLSFTGLIAICYALHRLSMPRHPPYALSSLITKYILMCYYTTLRSACVFNANENACTAFRQRFSKQQRNANYSGFFAASNSTKIFAKEQNPSFVRILRFPIQFSKNKSISHSRIWFSEKGNSTRKSRFESGPQSIQSRISNFDCSTSIRPTIYNPKGGAKAGGPKWSRTTHLALIRGAL